MKSLRERTLFPFAELDNGVQANIIELCSPVTRCMISMTTHKYKTIRPFPVQVDSDKTPKIKYDLAQLLRCAAQEGSATICAELILCDCGYDTFNLDLYKLLIPRSKLSELVKLTSSIVIIATNCDKIIGKIVGYAITASSDLGSEQFPPDNGNAIGLLRWMDRHILLTRAKGINIGRHFSQEALKMAVTRGLIKLDSIMMYETLIAKYDCAQGFSDRDYVTYALNSIYSIVDIPCDILCEIQKRSDRVGILESLCKIDPLRMIQCIINTKYGTCTDYKLWYGKVLHVLRADYPKLAHAIALREYAKICTQRGEDAFSAENITKFF